MKRLILSLAALLALGIVGCSSKNDTPNGPKPTPTARVVVTTPASAPSTTDVNSAVWNGVASTSLQIQDTTPVVLASIAGTNVLTDSVHIQALRLRDTLYLRIKWHDATHDIWPSRIDVSSCNGHPSDTCFVSQDGGIFEDRMMVLFRGFTGPKWDALDWRALTTAAGGLAMGAVLLRNDTASSVVDTVLVPDAMPTDLAVATSNYDALGFGTLFMHTDSNQFNGSILYSTEMVTFKRLGVPWAIGQRIPGYYIDSSVVHKDVTTRGSRWDTPAASAWDTTSGTYTVVLTHPMNTSYDDDVNLVGPDSVVSQVAVFDNQVGFARNNHRGYTLPFWFILQ